MPRNLPSPPKPKTPKKPLPKFPKVPVTNKPKPKVKPADKPERGDDKAVGSTGVQKRAQNRISRITARGGKLPHGVKPGSKLTLGQARAIKEAILKMNKDRTGLPDKPGTEKAAPFDPLAPLTGKAFDTEEKAASQLQFGESDRALGQAYEGNTQQATQQNSYYDEYKKSLEASAERLRQSNAANVTAGQTQVDNAYTQDKAAAEQRSTTANTQISNLGLTGTVGTEGEQQTEALRSQGNARVQDSRDAGQRDNVFAEGRVPNSILAKAEEMARITHKREQLDEDKRKLASDKGAFATKFRTDARASEREWAAVQKEFGLKEEELGQKGKDSAADRSIERQKLATQKLVAKLQTDANKTKAAATIRVAKLQLEKGKIDQHQYNEIVNIYKGLPKKGTATPAKDKTKPKGSGSGPDGSLAPWEVDGRDKAFTGFGKNNYKVSDHARAIQKAVAAGIPKRLAELAWKRYVKSIASHPSVTTAPNAAGQNSPG